MTDSRFEAMRRILVERARNAYAAQIEAGRNPDTKNRRIRLESPDTANRPTADSQQTDKPHSATS